MVDEVKQEVDQAIIDHPILVYSKTYCPHSKRAKLILERIPNKISIPKLIELDELGERGVEIQIYLNQLTGQRTVPNIFIHQKHIGGADDLSHLDQAGILRSMVTSLKSHHSSSRIFNQHHPLHSLPQAINYPILLVLLVFILAGIGYRIRSRASMVAVHEKQKL